MSVVYARDFVTGTQNMDEWSLLQAMARVDNVECFVRGQTLYYRAALTRGKASIVELDWETNLIDVSVQHSPQFSQIVKVNVKAWKMMSRTGSRSTVSGLAGMPIAATQQTSESTSSYTPQFGTRTSVSSSSSTMSVGGIPLRSSSGGGATTVSGGSFSSGFLTMPKGPSALEYTFHVPGINRGQADALARKFWIAISSHLFQMNAQVAVTPDVQALLNQDTIFRLKGPIPSHNLDYNVRRVSQSFSVGQSEGAAGGWTYSVDGVNVPIVEQVV